MLAAAPHRGPDGIYAATRDNAALGYASLEITPESRGEKQPVVHEPTGITLVASVRLDNRDDLNRALGGDFMAGFLREVSTPPSADGSPTDAQILLAAYLRWEEAFLPRALGDFALAVWDPRKPRLLLARDALGMRPLYYSSDSRRSAFASEVKQILALPGVERRINDTAVAGHLSSAHTPLDASFYQGIHQVEAATAVTLSPAGRQTHRFWTVDPGFRIRHRTEQEYVEHFRDIFLRSVRRRLRTDRIAGISLSGGMDSGSVAAAAGWLRERGESVAPKEFHSYSYAFEKFTDIDERWNSSRITDRYGIPAIDVPADDGWVLQGYPDHGPDRDEPFFGSFQYLIEKLLGAARKDDVRLLLGGDRGDLLVGSAVTDLPSLLARGRLITLYRELRVWATPTQLPREARRRLIKPAASDLFMALMERLRPGWRPRPRDGKSGLRAEDSLFVNPDFLRRHFEPGSDTTAATLRRHSTRRRHRLIFTPFQMKGVLWSERTAALHGMEFADAFSDRELVEFILAIPQDVVNRMNAQKRILRAAMDGIMPGEAIRDATKVSPEELFILGLRHKARTVVETLLHDSVAAKRGYIDASRLKPALKSFLEGKNAKVSLWPVLSLEMWLREYWE